MRQLQRQKKQLGRWAVYCGARRWSSDEAERKWSTPLAKQLSEAITVRNLVEIINLDRMDTDRLPGYRPCATCKLYAHVFGV